MSIRVEWFDSEGGEGYDELEKKPDTCPLCNMGIDPILHFTYHEPPGFQVIYRCPRRDCQRLFIGYYSRNFTGNYVYLRSLPSSTAGTQFPETITGVSEKFQEIYNQAEEAESRDLLEICGCGYRKALEFLVKDFARSLTKNEEEKENISTLLLGNVINNVIEDERIKETARRASWLGNDETHYIRKWESMGLKELKQLIRLAINWIDSYLMTEEIVAEMNPDNNPD